MCGQKTTPFRCSVSLGSWDLVSQLVARGQRTGRQGSPLADARPFKQERSPGSSNSRRLRQGLADRGVGVQPVPSAAAISPRGTPPRRPAAPGRLVMAEHLLLNRKVIIARKTSMITTHFPHDREIKAHCVVHHG
ncbi:hypothetical protein NDU88_009498 [Pleurodeles waltl]|uniref:Uncharacterized protein n=1 Tax=Pleurodeles waltl TaxID=8319 RepID=A0AAV7QRQ4_PLEWA|nr:hypothetical protein NDU88_009498 [Pleurodeles waltl]